MENLWWIYENITTNSKPKIWQKRSSSGKHESYFFVKKKSLMSEILKTLKENHQSTAMNSLGVCEWNCILLKIHRRPGTFQWNKLLGPFIEITCLDFKHPRTQAFRHLQSTSLFTIWQSKQTHYNSQGKFDSAQKCSF